ncbi:MAG: hypothetical protein M1531_01940, partial [Chloroflexi bacterium]|nr:hypothetical protein [Chloroflexota bacterium]
MIDSVSSIMSAISMLGNAGRIGDLANADPAFLQLLQALAGPSTGTNGSLPGVALQAARGTEALAALPGVAVHDDAPAGASDSGPTAAPPETPPTLGKDQDSPTAALEMVLALMAALASPLQPWQASAPGDTEVKSIEATTSDGQVAAVTAPGDAAPSPSAGAIPSAEAPTAGQPALAMGDGQVTLAGLLAGGRQARASEQTGGGQAAQAGEAMTAVGGKTEIQPRPDEARPGESRPAALSLPTADAGSTEGTF